MKHLFRMILAAVVLLGLHSCTDETIGVSITDSVSSIIEDSSFVITGHSVLNDRVQMRTTTKMLGNLNAAGFGSLTASAVTMWMPSSKIDTTRLTIGSIDSCRLKLRLPNTGGYTGNAQAPMRMEVYRLNKPLPSPIFSDFDPTDYYDSSDLLASESYSPTSGWLEVSTATYSGTTTTGDTVRVISVPMPLSLAHEIYNAYLADPSRFLNPKDFADIFPGIYITNSYGSGHVLNIKSTELDVFYHRHCVVNDTTEVDSTYSQTYLASTPEVVSDNIIHYDIDDAVKQMVNAGQAIIAAPAGYEVQLRFPVQDIIDKYKANVGTNQAIINKLSLELPVSVPETEYNIQPPTYLLMVKTSKKYDFINGDSLVNNKDSFYATYDATTRSYVFSGLRDYVINIINNQGGIASEDDFNFTVTPVDVTTYTYPQNYNYYYYGSTTTSVVTKISPMVTRPAIVRLLLDKAKIKMTYSKQIVD
jgi:hypothetical protein